MAKPPTSKKVLVKRRLKRPNKAGSSNKKVRTQDLSANDESPPWEEDDNDIVIKQAEALVKPPKKKSKTVREYGDAEDDLDIEDDIDHEASMRFKRAMRRVAKRVSSKRRAYNSPATQELVTREALASVVRQIPKAELNYKASGAERAAYAYTNLINNARELMADLRAMSSTDALAEQIVREAITPAFMQLINYVLTEVGTMRSKITSANDVKTLQRLLNEHLNKMLVEIGTFGDETLEKASEDARKALKV